MSPLHIIAVGAAQFIYVGLRAIQQRFVIHNNRGFVMPTSLVMAMFEVFVYASIARAAITGTVWEAVAMGGAMGIGGGLGCLVAMRLHDRLTNSVFRDRLNRTLEKTHAAD